MQESDSAEQLMSAFGTAAGLIQQSEFLQCQSQQAGPHTALQQNGISEVDAESLAAAKQVQAELHRAMHAALSTNNGYLIIPTMPSSPIHRRYVHVCASVLVMMCIYTLLYLLHSWWDASDPVAGFVDAAELKAVVLH